MAKALQASREHGDRYVLVNTIILADSDGFESSTEKLTLRARALAKDFGRGIMLRPKISLPKFLSVARK